MACSGVVFRHHGAIYPNDMGHGETVYNHFNSWSKSRRSNIIFSRLLSLLDVEQYGDWSATALNGSNIRAFK